MELQQIKTGNDNITIITDTVIESIAKIKAFNLTQMNEELYKLHKKLLYIAKKKNKSHEVGLFWNLADTDECYVIYGTMNGIDMNREEEAKTGYVWPDMFCGGFTQPSEKRVVFKQGIDYFTMALRMWQSMQKKLG